MQCPKCNMNNRDENKVCMYCGFEFGNTNVNQVIPNNIPQQQNANNGVNNNPAVQNNVQNVNNGQNNKLVEVPPTKTRSRILITLPAFGILLVYSYIIISLSVIIYSMLAVAHKYNVSIMNSTVLLKYVGIDLLLIVSFILTLLHKKFMGFAAILYSVVYLIYYIVIIIQAYQTIKINLLLLPLIICTFVIVCAVFYSKEEEPI